MDGFEIIHYLSVNALLLSLAATRVAIIFIILPLFNQQLIPPLVRNSIFLALAILALIVQPVIDITKLSNVDWIMLFSKEAVIGIMIGVLFGVYLWAFETAGQIIDSQIGASVAQVVDPLTGSQTTLIGSFLARLANYIFVTAGGLMLLSGILLESYAIWPLEAPLPKIQNRGILLLGSEFSYYFKLAIMVAAPMILVTLMIDTIMGLINRYAQQFNVFFLSLSLKMLAALSMLFISIIAIVQVLLQELNRHSESLPEILKSVIG